MSRRFVKSSADARQVKAIFWVILAINVAFWGLVIWGLISLVNWVVAQ